jgi:hypothetical protein
LGTGFYAIEKAHQALRSKRVNILYSIGRGSNFYKDSIRLFV